jgi:hypothetical protein
MKGRTDIGSTRRSLIGRGLAAIGGLVGAGATGAGVAQAASTSAAPAGTGRLVLHGRNWLLQTPNRRSGEQLVAGEQGTLHGDLVDAEGRVIGQFYGSRMAMQSSIGGPIGVDASMELHTFRLEGGTLLGMGSTVGGESVFAITGGTGRFAGSHGTYVARQSLRELGGDGRAEFTIDLLAPREAPWLSTRS